SYLARTRGVLFLAAMTIPAAAIGCGWWGDGESDADGDAVTIDIRGRVTGDSPSSDESPEALTREANRLRSYGVAGHAGAFRLYRRAAESGYAPAQNNLGVAYEEGIGVAPDPVKAAYWYRLAARQGIPHAQHSLGTMLLTGRGVDRDIAAGIRWIESAAAQGHAAACADLGRIYAEGRLVKKDPDKAAYWRRKARNLGYSGTEATTQSPDTGQTGN
ncbi:MAG TPA: sel1 repeat family protein, partial [Sedimenticola thiotaurini]|nr:sel1 repeat family protein [Sedimenticola thiotaurini]